MRLLTAILLICVVSTALSQDKHALPLMPPASNEAMQGFVRIINLSDKAGDVHIYATDDTGQRFGPITLSIEANQVAYFNSQDLERGNSSKGLSGGVGDGEGNWWLELDTGVGFFPIEIRPLAYIRTPDGFLTSMHDVVPEPQDEGPVTVQTPVHKVPFFNPASNPRLSILRIVNPNRDRVDVTITGIDDEGMESSGTVTGSLEAGAAVMLNAVALERGEHPTFFGRLGDGQGKWEFRVSATRPIWVMSLMQGLTGHLTNMSTDAPSLEVPDQKPEGPRPPKPDNVLSIHLAFTRDVLIQWFYNFGYSNHALTHVYRNTTDDFESAIEIGTSRGLSYRDRNLSTNGPWWYWIRWESTDGVLGLPSDPERVTLWFF